MKMYDITCIIIIIRAYRLVLRTPPKKNRKQFEPQKIETAKNLKKTNYEINSKPPKKLKKLETQKLETAKNHEKTL